MPSITALLASCGLLAHLVTALPTPSPSCSSSTVNANFDDLTPIPGSAFGTIPIPYKGLQYQGFNYLTVVQTNAAPGVLDHSPPNYAVSNVASQTLQGTAMLTTNYQGSTPLNTFDLQSFYYGCSLMAANGAAAAPVQCTVSIAGYKGNDNTVSGSTEICSQTFQYNPTTMVGVQNMAYTGQITSACKGANFIQVQYTIVGGLAAAGVDLQLSLDDVVYKLNTCK